MADKFNIDNIIARRNVRLPHIWLYDKRTNFVLRLPFMLEDLLGFNLEYWKSC